MTITRKQVCNRLPIEYLPLNKGDGAVLSAISRLKTERNNALYAESLIDEHNKLCEDSCDPERCGYAIHNRRCPDCPKDYMIDL